MAGGQQAGPAHVGVTTYGIGVPGNLAGEQKPSDPTERLREAVKQWPQNSSERNAVEALLPALEQQISALQKVSEAVVLQAKLEEHVRACKNCYLSNSCERGAELRAALNPTENKEKK